MQAVFVCLSHRYSDRRSSGLFYYSVGFQYYQYTVDCGVHICDCLYHHDDFRTQACPSCGCGIPYGSDALHSAGRYEKDSKQKNVPQLNAVWFRCNELFQKQKESGYHFGFPCVRRYPLYDGSDLYVIL